MDIDQSLVPLKNRHGLWRELLSSIVLIGCVVCLLLVASAFGRI